MGSSGWGFRRCKVSPARRRASSHARRRSAGCHGSSHPDRAIPRHGTNRENRSTSPIDTRAVAVRPDAWRARPLKALLAAAALASVVLAPFLYPYWLVHTEQGLVRSVGEVTRYSATWRDWLSTGGRLHYEWWGQRWYAEALSSLFPGITVVLLALAALARGEGWRDPRARMALAIGAAGAALAFGVNLPGYRLLYEHVRLLQGIRAVSRFGWLTLFALPILAGFTVAAWTRCRSAAAAAALPIVLSAAVTIVTLRAPMGFTVYEGIPKI